MATRKAPTGAKHDRCIGHVEHPYPSKGMLCYGEVIGRDGMVEFADHLAKTRAEHRAADLARPIPQPSAKARRLAGQPVRPVETPLNDGMTRHKCAYSGDHDSIRVSALLASGKCLACGWIEPSRPYVTTTNAYGGTASALLIGPFLAELDRRPELPADAFTPRPTTDAVPLAELVARFRAMRGQPVAEPPAVVAPVRKTAGADMRAWKARERAARKLAADIGDAMRAEIAETPARHLTYADRPSFTYCAQPWTARDISAPDNRSALSVLASAGDTCELCIEACDRAMAPEPVNVEPCPYTVGHTACVAGARGHDGPHDWPSTRELREAAKAEPVNVELCPAAADGYLVCTRPAGHGGKHAGPAPMLPAQRCLFLHYGGGTSINDIPRCTLLDGHDGAHVWPVEPDTYAAAVEVAETRPDPCEECGHPAHGATCAVCDDAAQVGTYAPCSLVAPVQAPVEPASISWHCADCDRDYSGPVVSHAVHHVPAEPAPVLSAPAPVTRPTCERCGQVFRLKGSGAEWHRVNRPDCARVAVAV